MNTFLPLLQRTITINQIFTQEPNVPSPTTLDTVFALQNLTSSIYTEVAKKQGNNQITVKQRKNGNSPDTDSNEFFMKMLRT